MKTWSSLSIFFLAMVLHPECQIKAQEEIDAVIGSDRLPEFEDRESLPYVECILQETLRHESFHSHISSSSYFRHCLRWNQSVPLSLCFSTAPKQSCHLQLPTGAPHRSLDDDIYNGMFIPKGSIVIANIRSASSCTMQSNEKCNTSLLE
jgi:hypothetical protein